MMKSAYSLLLVLAVLITVGAFTPANRVHRKSALSLGVVPPPVELNVAASFHQQQSPSAMQRGVQDYLSTSTAFDSSSLALSLKDRPAPPTAEEIAAKKNTFNLWFWGGGFVAPFVATVYYFGPKFYKR
jgi:hypothetical protein